MASNIKITELTSSNSCAFCQNAIAHYCCPKCNQLYCSVVCYQSGQHESCSEAFYKSLVLQNLESSATIEGKEQMKKILERDFHNRNLISDETTEDIDSDDDVDEEDLFRDLGERLSGIDLDDCEGVWEHLTEDERKDFEKFLLSEDVSAFIERWTPWWDKCFESPVVDLDALEDLKTKCPKVFESIKSFEEISAKPPATCVEHNFVNILASYCFTMRYFNGETEDFASEIATFIYTLSLNLSKNCNFDNFNQAIGSVKEQCMNGEKLGILTDDENLSLIKSDVHSIMHGPHATERKFYILSCLSHIKQLFIDAFKSSASKTENNGEFFKKFTAQQSLAIQKVDKATLKRSGKKLDYYLSYVKNVYEV